MTVKQIVTVVSILLTVILVVGLVICRPMAVSRYASGIFNLAAVDEARVRAYTPGAEGAGANTVVLAGDDQTLMELTGLFDGKGFGMTPAGLFSHSLPEPEEGDICWSVEFHCTISGSTLLAEYRGGHLMLTGSTSTLVTAQHLDSWAKQVYDAIAALYPEDEEES